MKSIAARPIDPVEADVVRNALLKAPLGDVTPGMVQQVDSLSVVGVCDCGCRSLYFRDIRSEKYRVADGVGYLPDGERIDIMVWASSGNVAALELVDHAGKGQLPTAESVCSWEEAGEREARK